MKQATARAHKARRTRSQTAGRWLLFWTLFIGLGAVAGASGMLLDLAAYDHVTICTPIWVFSLASPVREFCRQAAGKIQEVDYILVHHTKGQYQSVAAEMDRLLGVTHTACLNVQCRMGAFRVLK